MDGQLPVLGMLSRMQKEPIFLRRLNAGLRQKISDLFAEYYASGKAGSEGLPAFLRFPMRAASSVMGPSGHANFCTAFWRRKPRTDTAQRFSCVWRCVQPRTSAVRAGRCPGAKHCAVMRLGISYRHHLAGSGRQGRILAGAASMRWQCAGRPLGVLILRWPGPACRTRDQAPGHFLV